MLLVGKPEGKRPLEKLRRRWVDNIKIDLRVIGWDDMDWIGLAQATATTETFYQTELNTWN
jgi:hypothetical protein